jgi:hypothetical protein
VVRSLTAWKWKHRCKCSKVTVWRQGAVSSKGYQRGGVQLGMGGSAHVAADRSQFL